MPTDSTSSAAGPQPSPDAAASSGRGAPAAQADGEEDDPSACTRARQAERSEPSADAPTTTGPATGARWAAARARRRVSVRGLWTAALVVLPAVALAVQGYRQRWIADDGLIYVRTVREILAGHGPVFNQLGRAESSTGTLWQWLLTAASWLTGRDPAPVAVYLGLACASAGLLIALDGTRRLHRAIGGSGWLAPAAVLVLVALPPEWEFATSGLETGLATLWMAVSWWLLVRAPRTGHRSVRAATAVVMGLGPLIRPDLALVSLLFVPAVLVVWRPRFSGMLGLVGAGVALPLAYEVFRMGFYGELVPLPAITKEAGGSDWMRGFTYLRDFAGPYKLWIPALLLIAALVVTARRLRYPHGPRLRWATGARAAATRQVIPDVPSARAVARGVAGTSAELASAPPRPDTGGPGGGRPGRAAGRVRRWWAALRERPYIPVVAAPLCCGVVMVVYVVRLGGDFMHARMLLPGLFMLVVPFLLVPLSRLVVPAVLALAAWAGLCATGLRISYEHRISPTTQISDEHGFWVTLTKDPHPVTAAPFVTHLSSLQRWIDAAPAYGPHTLVIVNPLPTAPAVWYAPLAPGIPARIVGVGAVLGTLGATVPLDDVAVDQDGLAYPLAAHVELTGRTRAGHEKLLPVAWIIADYTAPGTVVPPTLADPGEVAAARHALGCGPLKELQDSVHAPMTFGRFWDNFLGAFRETTFRFPDNPYTAERQLCGPRPQAGAASAALSTPVDNGGCVLGPAVLTPVVPGARRRRRRAHPVTA